MAAAPSHKPGNVIVGDLAQQLGRAEVLDQALNITPGVSRSRVVLADLLPVAARHVV